MASPASTASDALIVPSLRRLRSLSVQQVDWDTHPPTVSDILAVLARAPGSSLVTRGFSLLAGSDQLQDAEKRARVYTCERGVEVILETMDAYQDSLVIQRLGCTIVRFLTRDSPCLPILAAKVRMRLRSPRSTCSDA